MNFMDQSFVAKLSQHGFVRAQGADARTFLQGQLSNDLRRLSADRAQLSSYNSPKGRMLAVLHLIADADDVVIELHHSVLGATLKRLRMFVLRAKVTLEDISSACCALGLAGPQAAEWLRAQALPAPAAALETAAAGELVVMRRLGDVPRYSVHGPAAAIDALHAQWQQHAQGSERDWQRLDILAGVPTVFSETVDHFVPQMANLDRLGGISFDKGCYTGQEIVARLHYLGQLKRRMFRSRVDGHASVTPGTAIYDAGETQAVGEVLQSANDGDGCLLSVVLQLSHAGSAQLRLGSADGPLIAPPEA